jgi:hypothetical protein
MNEDTRRMNRINLARAILMARGSSIFEAHRPIEEEKSVRFMHNIILISVIAFPQSIIQ